MFGPNCPNGPNESYYSGKTFIINDIETNWKSTCNKNHTFIGQDPPWWPTLGQGRIHVVIRKPANASDAWISPFTGSNISVALISGMFPPSKPHYPDSTYLWTWYDYSHYPDNPAANSPFIKTHPITFMQSAPGIGVGTNLALADYFDFHVIESDLKLPHHYIAEKLDKACGKSWRKAGDPNDKERAEEKVPRDHYKGSNFSQMAAVLNHWISSANPTKPCNNWTVQELQKFQEMVYEKR